MASLDESIKLKNAGASENSKFVAKITKIQQKTNAPTPKVQTPGAASVDKTVNSA